MKVWLTCPPVEGWPWEGASYVSRVRELFERSSDRRGHELADCASNADLVLYLEPNGWRDRAYAEVLLREENIRRFPEKCFAYNYADYFLGFLPGLYVGLPRRHALDSRFASWSYVLGLPNRFVEEFALEREHRPPSRLFSFRGSDSATVRRTIFAHAATWSAVARIVELRGVSFYQVPEELQRIYAEEMVDSQFALCPRGLGASSHRLFETMALGRVPVILSDDWTPPAGPDWPTFSLRIAEKDVAQLPELLREAEQRAPTMGLAARRAWETWFAPTVVVPRLFDRLATLQRDHQGVPPDYGRQWRSSAFYRPYGLALEQRLWRNLRSGELLNKIMRRLRGAR